MANNKLLSEIWLMIPDAATVPPDVTNKWEESTALESERANEARKQQIPDEERFQSKLAKPSSTEYSQILNPSFISRRGLSAKEIANRHTENLSKAYKKYKKGLDYAFETVDGVPAKRFKDAVKAKKDNYALAASRKVLPFSGMRVGQKGIMTIAPEWLTAEPMVAGHLRDADKIVAGNPIMICRKLQRSAFRAGLATRLQQAGAIIVDSKFDTAIISSQNDTTNELVQGLVNTSLGLATFTTGGASHVDFVSDEASGLWLKIKVSKA